MDNQKPKTKTMNKYLVVIASAITALIISINTAQAMPVTVVNWSALMQLIQKQVSQFLSNKIQQVWEKELGEKLKAGKLNADSSLGVFKDFNGSINEYLNKNAGAYVGQQSNGGFAPEQVASNVLSSAKNILTGEGIKFSQGTSEQMQQAQKIADLIAGMPKKISQADLQNDTVKNQLALDSAARQTTQASYLKANQANAVASELKKDLQKITGATIDSGTSDQAVKDLAKIMLLRLKLEAESLELSAISEQRNALSTR